jgi:two-component system chemotaxis sensor kinase CheA
VDEVRRVEEYVVKKLPWNLKRVFTVSGAVVLPDGSLAVAVDPVRLVDLAVTSVEGGAQVATTVSKRKPLILVADDSLVSRTLQYNSLAAAGYDVVLAVDGEEAWRALHEHEIDLLVSDVRMPGIDGLELTRRVRADARLAHLPVILVTGLADPEAVSSGAAAGADEYVVKGDLDQEKLLEAVVRLL